MKINLTENPAFLLSFLFYYERIEGHQGWSDMVVIIFLCVINKNQLFFSGKRKSESRNSQENSHAFCNTGIILRPPYWNQNEYEEKALLIANIAKLSAAQQRASSPSVST